MMSVFKFAGITLAFALALSSESHGWEIPLPSMPSLPSLPSWLKGEEVDRFSSVWDDSMKKLDSALERLDNSDSLPDERLIGNDKTKNENKIDAILQDVVTILTDSETGDPKKRVFRGAVRPVPAGRGNLASLKEKRVSAPESGGLLKKGKRRPDRPDRRRGRGHKAGRN